MTAVPTSKARARTVEQRSQRSSLTPYLFILPHLIFFVVFLGYPLFYGLYISLFNYDFNFPSYRPFVGLQNYVDLFNPDSAHYETFWRAVKNTLTFVAYSVPPMLALPLGLAVLLNGNYRGRNFFRALFFAPWSLSVVVASILWWWLFLGSGGLVNAVLTQLGLGSVGWLSTGERVANWMAITIATVWWTAGFNTIILLAALQEIPDSLYEAGAIDGAGKWKQFRHITLPMLQPVLTFVLTIQIIASFNLFGQPWIMMTRSNQDTQTIIMSIYTQGFAGRVGMAAAMSFVVAAMMIAVTFASNRIFRKREEL